MCAPPSPPVQAGSYGQYMAVTSAAAVPCLADAHRNGTAPAWGPAALVHGWLAPRPANWCFAGTGPGRFDARFLVDWGARWAPLMRSRCGAACVDRGGSCRAALRAMPPQLLACYAPHLKTCRPRLPRSPQRWLTSALLHQSFTHVLTNCLVGCFWAALGLHCPDGPSPAGSPQPPFQPTSSSQLLVGFGWQLESKHGTWRVALLGVLAALGGNLLRCVAVQWRE